MGEYDLFNPYGQNEQKNEENTSPAQSSSPPDGEYHYTGRQIENSYSSYTGSASDNGNRPSHGQASPYSYTPPQSSFSGQPEESPGKSPRRSHSRYSHHGAGKSWPDDKPDNGGGRKGISFLSIVAIVLVCTLAGFGGGALAIELMGNKPSVVYQAPPADANSTSYKARGDFSDIADFASPSVVSIETGSLSGGFIPASGAGSGVIITEDGYIITNHHVISEAKSINVILENGDSYKAKLIGSDADSDIAVLKIEATGLAPATLGDSESLRVGQNCLAIGNPMGNLGGTVTNGIISALSREIIIDGVSMTLLQMNAAVSPGNSGGGLFDDQGHLIGIVNAKSIGDYAEGLGFAIPVNKAMKVAQEIMETGRVSKPMLGVSVRTYASDEEAIADGYDKAGIYIKEVTPGGAADIAGLKVNDRIFKFNDIVITRSITLTDEIAKCKVGDKATIEVERSGETLSFEVVLQEKAVE